MKAGLRRLIAAKKIPHYYDGRLFFMSADLEAWLDRQRKPARDEPQSKHLVIARPAAPVVDDLADLMPVHRRLSRAG